MNKISLDFMYKKLFDAQLEKDWYKAEEIRVQIRRIENDIGEDDSESLRIDYVPKPD